MMIWLIGCNGNLGTEIKRLLEKDGREFCCTDSNVDISDYDALEMYAKGKTFDWIINCAAYTDVDKAEDDRERAFQVNEIGARNCARIARECGSKLVHISTDYVFGGLDEVPVSEDTPAAPVSVYGASKAAGENAVGELICEHYIIRTAWLYGNGGRNFVRTILKLLTERPVVRVVNDQTGTPTCADDVASVIMSIIEKGNIPFGTYHCTDCGKTTWYDFACAIKDEAVKCGLVPSNCARLESCTTAEYASRAVRPAYSVLSKEKLETTLGMTMPDWKESLHQFLEALCGV